MEENQNLVIGFLVVVILILLFSKISIQYHGTGNPSNSSSFMPTPTQVKLPPIPIKKQSSNNDLDVNGVTAGQPTEEPANPLSGLNIDDEYMPEELRKQVQDLENRFYTHDCGN